MAANHTGWERYWRRRLQMPCQCEHVMAEHRLDWSDPDDDLRPDCDHDGCNCPEFTPAID